ncbi:ATPase family gene 2 protein homolog B [Eucyclogobius newberryi]|uniref:ATPase family gene 2 protein homolog B n=1 Tax=Eucyclogobius newberryi TaxID=166745 RepID=UPI003B5CA0A9
MDSLRLLSVYPCDGGSQRCRLGPGLMSSLGLHLGSPLLVSMSGSSCLCTAWPRPDSAEGFIQMDLKSCSPNLTFHPFTSSHINVNQILPVQCPKLKGIKITVVVQSSEFRSNTPQRIVHELVKDMLKGVYVHKSHVINLGEYGTEIKYAVIEEVNSESGSCGLVTSKTGVEVLGIKTLRHFKGGILQQNNTVSLGGLDEVRSSLRETLQLPLVYPQTLSSLGLSRPRGVLLVGPPGVGKTQLVRSVVREVGASLVVVHGPEIVGARPGESEEKLRAVFSSARSASDEGPCVLFLDELDSLCPKRTGSTAAENRLVAQLLTLMDGMDRTQRFLIIGATNRPHSLDPALRRPGRFDREVIIGAPTLQQRRDILRVLFEKIPLCSSVDAEGLAQRTTGYVGADLSALCREAAMNSIRETAKGSGEQTVTMKHFTEALKTVGPSCLRSSLGRTDLAPVSWDQIGGLDHVKLKLRQSIEWPLLYPDAFGRLGLSRPRGVLLYGPPGCAKTTLVRATASSSHCSFLSVSGADLYSPYVGDSEKALTQLFRQARSCAPCVLFLDEIDSLIGCRSSGAGSSGVQTRLLSVLLNEMDGVGLKTEERRGSERVLQAEGEDHQHEQTDFEEVCNSEVMVVAATNRPDALDSALLRPGRLDHIIYVPPPDQESRLSILKLCTKSMPVSDEVCLEELSQKTHFFSGADLENLCKEAALLALQEENMEASHVRHKHFLHSLCKITPSLTEQQIQMYQNPPA